MTATTIKTKKDIEVKILIVNAEVRYWEDAEVNGKEDTDGILIPCRNGENWMPIIDLETGIIINWTIGNAAKVHYKVCDDGKYKLVDASGRIVKEIEGYVPKMLCPEKNGYGDYIIMKIDTNGKIDKWIVDLSEFEDEEN